ncbi:ribbon-helix-helix protein [Xanthomonas phage Xoo-sp13]|nr:ribbon-helix-helix protein [Xanthomonas phage Xoo-sp13]
MIIQCDSKLTRTLDSLGKNRFTRAEIIRQSIALLKMVVEANNLGNKVVLIAKDGREREIIVN